MEQGDWAGATSSASSKLIHGGLRYLETWDFKLVRKAIRERQRLLELAPHRVWPLRFGVPVYNDSRIGMLRLKAGLTLYDLLAGFPGEELAHRRFDRSAFAERFPFLADTGLKGGFTYGDAQTDDARLVLELIDGAMEAGAVCVNYCRLTGLIESDGQAYGATVLDMTNEQQRAGFCPADRPYQRPVDVRLATGPGLVPLVQRRAYRDAGHAVRRGAAVDGEIRWPGILHDPLVRDDAGRHHRR